jgi:hypothetical protein
LEERQILRGRIHAAARNQYKWLRPDIDPRVGEQGQALVRRPPDPRFLNRVSADLADLVSARAQLLTHIAELKWHKPIDGEYLGQLQADLVQIERSIEAARHYFDQIPLTGGRPPVRLIAWRHKTPGYLFAGRPLLPNYIEAIGASCAECGRAIMRSKRPLDCGCGIRLYGLSCLCKSLLVSPKHRIPSQETWGLLNDKPPAQAETLRITPLTFSSLK